MTGITTRATSESTTRTTSEAESLMPCEPGHWAAAIAVHRSKTMLTIEIENSGAAFDDPRPELARILRELAGKLEAGRCLLIFPSLKDKAHEAAKNNQEWQ